jgi:hypothetical protein
MSTLTRHFYALDEVVAALSYCCIAGRPREACFWLQELIDSGEAAFAIKAMVEAYLLNCGVTRLGWLIAAHGWFSAEEVDEESLYEACISLCRIKVRDYSLIGLHLGRMADGQRGPPPLIGAEWHSAQQYMTIALSQGNARAAFWTTASLDPNSVLTILRSQANPTLVQPLEIIYGLNAWAGTSFAQHTIVCLLLMVCCLRADEYEDVFKPPTLGIPATVIEEKIQWAALQGRRARRLYTIPEGCFYLVTRRGRMPWSESTDPELRTIGDQRLAKQHFGGCEHWNSMIDECTEGDMDEGFADNEGLNDESWESFANKAFVDDIPDEWSLEERLKSHGPGKCGQATACATVSKWLRYNVSVTDMGSVTFKGSRFMTGFEAVAKQAIDLCGADRHIPVDEQWSAATWLGSLCCVDPSVAQLTNMLAAIRT